MAATKNPPRVAGGAQAYLTKDVLHDEMLRAIHAVHAGGKYLPASVSAALNRARARRTERAGNGRTVADREGPGNKQIAYQLGIAEHTVKNHVKSILSKLSVDDRTQAATAAIQRGIIHL